MTSHETSHPESQKTCDTFLNLIRERLAGIQRKEAEKSCAFSHLESSKFIFLYHRKKTPEVRIYFRADPDLIPRGFPPNLNLQKRSKFDNSWAKRFPYFFDVSLSDNLEQVASFLVEEIYPFLLKSTARSTEKHLEPLKAGKIVETKKFVEGKARLVRLNVHERSRKARSVCLQHYGTNCAICEFSFASFDESFANSIHVHHLVPISSRESEYCLDPIEHLIPVCPNCHTVIHLRRPPFSIEEVKRMLKKNTN